MQKALLLCGKNLFDCIQINFFLYFISFLPFATSYISSLALLQSFYCGKKYVYQKFCVTISHGWKIRYFNKLSSQVEAFKSGNRFCLAGLRRFFSKFNIKFQNSSLLSLIITILIFLRPQPYPPPCAL